MNSRCALSTVQIPFLSLCPACWCIFLPPNLPSISKHPIHFIQQANPDLLGSSQDSNGQHLSQDRGCSPAQGEGCLDCFLQGWQAAGPGCCQSSLGCGVGWTCASCAPDLHYSSPASTGLYLSRSYLIRWCLIMLK